MTAAQTISFVIPVYRNERAVTLTYQKIIGALTTDLPGYAYEFVFVDDGSDDGSLEELLRLKAHDPRVRTISFTRNFGQMAAILAGLKGATGDLVLHLSADLQDPVELIPRMVRDYEAGSELVIGHRAERGGQLVDQTLAADPAVQSGSLVGAQRAAQQREPARVREQR